MNITTDERRRVRSYPVEDLAQLLGLDAGEEIAAVELDRHRYDNQTGTGVVVNVATTRPAGA